MARVHVSDEAWKDYRVLVGSTPVSLELGQLVEREVAAHRREQPKTMRESVVRFGMLAGSRLS